jgi:hypothetical protein
LVFFRWHLDKGECIVCKFGFKLTGFSDPEPTPAFIVSSGGVCTKVNALPVNLDSNSQISQTQSRRLPPLLAPSPTANLQAIRTFHTSAADCSSIHSPN